MKIKNLDDLINKNNDLQKNSTFAQRKVWFESALKFVKENLSKQIYETCYDRINPSIQEIFLGDQLEDIEKQDMVWICEYLVAHNNP